MRRLLIGALAWPLLAAAPAPLRAPVQQTPAEGYQTATFAGGCFWCMEPPFDELPGVISTTSGYTGGRTRNPTYEDVSAGRTGHAEAVGVVYDPARISYEQLLDVFWKNIDPITPNRQFCDVGTQYRSAIFYHGDEQRRLAEESKRAIESSSRFDKPIVTEIRPAGPFYTAEEYHQDERVARIEDPAQMAARPGHLGPDPPKPSGTSRPCSAETRRTSRARS